MGKLSTRDCAVDELQCIHADAHLLVLEKPAGLLCVPGRGADKQDCLATRAQRHYADALVVHRLDMATSGLWLMARGIDMQRRLSRAFADREVTKRYIAVVAGRPASGLAPGEWASIDLPLAADWPNRPRRIVDPERGKPSQTRWRVCPAPPATEAALLPPLPGEGWGGGTPASALGTTRLELEPVTGRSHQLRVHLQAIGHPILGDALYAPAKVLAQAPRLLLHAAQLRFRHPASGEALTFHSPAPF